MKKLASCNFLEKFRIFDKKSLQFLQVAKTFIIFFALLLEKSIFLTHLLRKTKKISQFRKIFIEYFCILRRIFSNFSCFVNNYSK